jgi:hypothetical protein
VHIPKVFRIGSIAIREVWLCPARSVIARRCGILPAVF